MKKLLIVSAIAATFSVASFAEQPSFNLIEVGINKYDDFDGNVISGSFEISDDFYGVASYERQKESITFLDLEATQTTIGAGFKMPVDGSTAFYAQFEYGMVDQNLEAEVPGFDSFTSKEETDAYILSVGARKMLTPQLEVYGELSYSKINEGDVVVNDGSTIESFESEGDNFSALELGSRYWFTDSLGGYVKYNRDSDSDDFYGVGLSLKF